MHSCFALGAALLATVLLAGCAGTDNRAPGNLVTVHIDRAQLVDHPYDVQHGARVEVTDIRQTAHMERTALGASLGAIDLQPPAPELVQAVVQAKAEEVIIRLGVAPPPLVLCGIRTFDITTPSTPLYWDIITRIAIVLRVHGQDRKVTASATDRTFVWPSEELIARVTAQALKNLASEAEPALAALLAAH